MSVAPHHALRLRIFTAMLVPLVAGFIAGATNVARANSTSLKVLLVGDTVDDRLGDGFDVNVENVRRVITEAYSANVDRYRSRVTVDVSKENASPQAIRDWILSLRSQGDIGTSTVLVYYAGHGGWDPQKGHFFAMNRGHMLRSEVRSLLMDVRPRAAIIISDCCSNYSRFDPPERRVPASWKVFDDLFFTCQPGVVDITAAEESQFAWASNAQGGMFTRALVKFLCEPRSTFDRDNDGGKVPWSEFFQRTRALTTEIFREARADAAANAEIRSSSSQDPYAFFLEQWPRHFHKRLVVTNATPFRLCIWVQYETVDPVTNTYQWRAATNKKVFYELAPGAEGELRHDRQPINARRIKIWANRADGGREHWPRYKEVPRVLCPDAGYVGPLESISHVFIYRP